MAKWLLIVETNCNDASKEKEFNEWYNSVHVLDVLGVPGIQRATRYENSNAGEGRGKFVALYEIDAEDIGATMADLQAGMAKWTEQGRVFEGLTIASGTILQQIHAPVDSK